MLGGKEAMEFPEGGSGERPRPGDATERPERRSSGGRRSPNARWNRPDAPWAPSSSPAGRPGDGVGDQTVVIRLGDHGQAGEESTGGGGGTSVPIYFRAQFEPRPPSCTAKIVAIFGLTLALQGTLLYVYDGTATISDPVQHALWWLGTHLLLVFLLPAISGVLVDSPESVWARRWMYLMYIGCTLVWLCGIASLYRQLA